MGYYLIGDILVFLLTYISMEKAVQFLKNNLKPTFSNRHRKLFLVMGALFALLFLLFTLIVRADLLRAFDFNTTVRLQDDIPVRMDGFFSFLSVVGRFETSIIVLLLILFFKRKILGFMSFGLFGFAHILEIIGKTILSQPGPPHMFLRTKEMASEFPGLYIHTDASYPSGHSLRVIFLCIIIVFIIWNMKKFPAYLKYFILGSVGLYTILMLVSRVSLGEHWTTDVVGGLLLGASFAFLSLLFL